MAKTSKLEDYWKQNNIETLLKEVTQVLTRRMPPDPAVAIVEHLQKKFPKSFKTLLTSPHSDIQNESMKDEQTGRRSSIQSQASGSIAIPTLGSAFTDLFKQNATGAQQAPEIDLKNVVMLNRLSQQVVKMGKDIRSEHDILEEELIKPMKTKSDPTSSAATSTNSFIDELHNRETHEVPSVKQLIKYKQKIRDENDRRLHRQKLAELAKGQRGKEEMMESASSKSEEFQWQPQTYDSHGDENLLQAVPTARSNGKVLHKLIAKSKEEEDILNEENVFQPKKLRYRTRQKDKSTTLANTLSSRRPISRADDGSIVCKHCGHVLNGQENQDMNSSELLLTIPGTHSLDPQLSARSTEEKQDVVDDFFEPDSSVCASRDASPSEANENLLSKLGSTTFRRDLFRPISSDNDTAEYEPVTRPLVSTDSETERKRLTTPTLSESGMFTRSPESKIRASPSVLQGTRSPVTMKQQTNQDSVTNPQSARTMAQTSSGRSTPSSSLPPKAASTGERRMSSWSVRENSPMESEDN